MSQPSPSPEPFWPSIVFELSSDYARDVLLPELLQRHLEAGGNLEYQVEVVARQNPPLVIYQSDPGVRISNAADASVGLFGPQYDRIFSRGGRGGRGRGFGGGPGGGGPGGGGPGPGPDSGRWQMLVRHRAGSLEAVVSRARGRNLAVTAGVLLLMIASLAALIRYTRRAQKPAELQMDFVAGRYCSAPSTPQRAKSALMHSQETQCAVCCFWGLSLHTTPSELYPPHRAGTESIKKVKLSASFRAMRYI
jgi:hypothetical protein